MVREVDTHVGDRCQGRVRGHCGSPISASRARQQPARCEWSVAGLILAAELPGTRASRRRRHRDSGSSVSRHEAKRSALRSSSVSSDRQRPTVPGDAFHPEEVVRSKPLIRTVTV